GREYRFGHPGPRPRHDRIGPDSIPAEALRGRQGETDDPGFRGRVVRLAGSSHECGFGGSVDDAPEDRRAGRLAGGPEMHTGGVAECGVALEVDVDDLVPLVLGEVEDHRVAHDPRVVDDDIEDKWDKVIDV